MKRRRRRRPVWPYTVAAGLVVGLVIAMAFFVRGFDDTGTDNLAAPGAGGADGAPSGAFASPSGSPVKSGAKKFVVPGGGPTLTLGANDGGGIRIDDKNKHTLVAHVSSSAPIYSVGYLIPTSFDAAYGRDDHAGTSWTVSTTVTGRPYYSIIWVAAGAAGAPVTCTITIDGKVRSSRTTSGAYGRQVCYA
jgi:hypothetical protein